MGTCSRGHLHYPDFYAETGLRREGALGWLLLQGRSWALTTSNKKSHKGRNTGI